MTKCCNPSIVTREDNIATLCCDSIVVSPGCYPSVVDPSVVTQKGPKVWLLQAFGNFFPMFITVHSQASDRCATANLTGLGALPRTATASRHPQHGCQICAGSRRGSRISTEFPRRLADSEADAVRCLIWSRFLLSWLQKRLRQAEAQQQVDAPGKSLNLSHEALQSSTARFRRLCFRPS